MAKQGPNISVLIPAAGSGSRMGGPRKQYRMLGGESILLRTLRVFDEHPRIDTIIVAAPRDHASEQRNALRDRGIAKLYDAVAGGENRQESVALALEAVPDATDLVLVHDAVRPFLPPDRIDAVIDAAEADGAAALAIGVRDTLRRVESTVFGETVSRSDLFRMQTPQAFRRDWFVQAHEAARRQNYVETDDVALVQRIGRTVRIVEGTSLNFKITTPEDWVLAQALWHQLSTAA